jgi:CBS-domain-containing membrane protein
MTYCSNLLDHDFQVLNVHDTVAQAIETMEAEQVFTLPVLDGQQFLGVVELDDLESASLQDELETLQPLFLKVSVRTGDHFIQALRLRSKYQLDIVPVLNEQQEWEGVIESARLLDQASQLLGAEETGSMVVLGMSRTDYAPGEINRLVESNDATIMNMNAVTDPASGMLQVMIRINKEDISGIIATFQRYEYKVLYHYGEEAFDNSLQNNLEHLFNYLNI